MITAAISHDLLDAPKHTAPSRRPRRGEPPRSSPRHLTPLTVVTGASSPRTSSRRTVTRKGWAASCLTQLLPPVTGCVKVESHSACAPCLLRGRGRTYLRTAPLSHRGSPPPLRVAGSPVTFLAATSVTARPRRCQTGLSVARSTWKTATWCPEVVFCPKAQAWTRL